MSLPRLRPLPPPNFLVLANGLAAPTPAQVPAVWANGVAARATTVSSQWLATFRTRLSEARRRVGETQPGIAWRAGPLARASGRAVCRSPSLRRGPLAALRRLFLPFWSSFVPPAEFSRMLVAAPSSSARLLVGVSVPDCGANHPLLLWPRGSPTSPITSEGTSRCQRELFFISFYLFSFSLCFSNFLRGKLRSSGSFFSSNLGI